MLPIHAYLVLAPIMLELHVGRWYCIVVQILNVGLEQLEKVDHVLTLEWKLCVQQKSDKANNPKP